MDVERVERVGGVLLDQAVDVNHSEYKVVGAALGVFRDALDVCSERDGRGADSVEDGNRVRDIVLCLRVSQGGKKKKSRREEERETHGVILEDHSLEEL